MTTIEKIAGKGLVGAALFAGALGYVNHKYFPRETRAGEYQGYKVEAFKGGSLRTVIIFPEGRPERVIGTDYTSESEGFDLVETMFLSETNPLRKLATNEHVEAAWDGLYGKR